MSAAAPAVLVFDSGVGGLSVYRHIRGRLPGLSTIYLADHAGFPYGPKSEAEILARVVGLVERAVGQFQPGLVVIACNTASTLVLPKLRERLRIPVVGVVPAIKTAAVLSRTRSIGLLATPGTIAREYTELLIGSFAPDCHIVRVGTTELVGLAEDWVRGIEPDPTQLRSILSPFEQAVPAVDAVVLGCTHFPLLRDQLNAVAKPPVQWVDSGEAIARRVEQLLQIADAKTGRETVPTLKQPRHLALSTKAYDEALAAGIQKFGFDQLAVMDD